jgi:hypothetical protein
MITGNPSLRTAENPLTSFFKFLAYLPFLTGKAQKRNPSLPASPIVKTELPPQIVNSQSIEEPEKPECVTHTSSVKAHPSWKPFQFSLNPDPFDWYP